MLAKLPMSAVGSEAEVSPLFDHLKSGDDGDAVGDRSRRSHLDPSGGLCINRIEGQSIRRAKAKDPH